MRTSILSAALLSAYAISWLCSSAICPSKLEMLPAVLEICGTFLGMSLLHK